MPLDTAFNAAELGRSSLWQKRLLAELASEFHALRNTKELTSPHQFHAARCDSTSHLLPTTLIGSSQHIQLRLMFFLTSPAAYCPKTPPLDFPAITTAELPRVPLSVAFSLPSRLFSYRVKVGRTLLCRHC